MIALHFSVKEKLVVGIKGPHNRLNGNMKSEEFWVEEKEEKVCHIISDTK
jgi:hypothetical protein